jgi:hypothetical protein
MVYIANCHTASRFTDKPGKGDILSHGKYDAMSKFRMRVRLEDMFKRVEYLICMTGGSIKHDREIDRVQGFNINTLFRQPSRSQTG